MPTLILLSVLAVLFAVAGTILTFVPDGVAAYLGAADVGTATVVYQLLGATYLGFAVLNWLSRRSKVGGIFGRPLVFANFMHLFVGFFAVARLALQAAGIFLWAVTVLYAIFSACFGYLLVRKVPG